MTYDEWDSYVSSGWEGSDAPHPEYDELCEASYDDPTLEPLVEAWRATRRKASRGMMAADDDEKEKVSYCWGGDDGE